MSQYISVKTKNVLKYKERMFHYRGRDFPGLVDMEAVALYDHPEDSFMESIGMRNSVDTGHVLPIQGEKVKWSDKYQSIWDALVVSRPRQEMVMAS